MSSKKFQVAIAGPQGNCIEFSCFDHSGLSGVFTWVPGWMFMDWRVGFTVARRMRNIRMRVCWMMA